MTPAVVAPLTLLAVGAHLSISFGRDLYFGALSRRWPHVRGRIRQLGTHEGSAFKDDSAATIVYEYSVDGVKLRSNRFDYAGRNSSDAGDLLATLRNGDAVSVWYDPSRPERAVLATGFQRANLVRIGIGVLFLVV